MTFRANTSDVRSRIGFRCTTRVRALLYYLGAGTICLAAVLCVNQKNAAAQVLLGAKDSRLLSQAECMPSPPRQTLILIDFAHITKSTTALQKFILEGNRGLVSEFLMLPGEPYHLIFFDSRVSAEIDAHIAGCYVGKEARSAPSIRDRQRFAQALREQDASFVSGTINQVIRNSPPRPTAFNAKQTHYLSMLARVTNELVPNAKTNRMFIVGDLALHKDFLDRAEWSVSDISSPTIGKLASRLKFQRTAVRVFGYSNTLDGALSHQVMDVWQKIVSESGGYLAYFDARYPGIDNLRPTQRPSGMREFFSGEGLIGMEKGRFEPESAALHLYLNIRDDREAFFVDWLTLKHGGREVNFPLLGGMSCSGGGDERCLYEGKVMSVPEAYSENIPVGSDVRLAVGEMAYGHLQHRVLGEHNQEYDRKSEIIATDSIR